MALSVCYKLVTNESVLISEDYNYYFISQGRLEGK